MTQVNPDAEIRQQLIEQTGYEPSSPARTQRRFQLGGTTEPDIGRALEPADLYGTRRFRTAQRRADPDRLRLMVKLFPLLGEDPGLATMFVQQNRRLDDDAFFDEAGRLVGLSHAERLVREFAGLDVANVSKDTRKQVSQKWEGLSPLQREYMIAAGTGDVGKALQAYDMRDDGKEGWFHHIATDPFEAVYHGGAKIAGGAWKGAGEALKVLAWPQEQLVLRPFRTAIMAFEQETGQSFDSPADITAFAQGGYWGAFYKQLFTDPGKLRENWETAGRAGGEAAFSMRAIDEARNLLGEDDELYAISDELAVEASAAGGKPDDVVMTVADRWARRAAGLAEDEVFDVEAPPPRYQEAFEEFVTTYEKNPKIEQAARELMGGHISPGRILADAALWGREPAYLYDWVSGGSDFATRVVADPLLVVGKAINIARGWRWAVGSGDLTASLRRFVKPEMLQAKLDVRRFDDLARVRGADFRVDRAYRAGRAAEMDKLNSQERIMATIYDVFRHPDRGTDFWRRWAAARDELGGVGENLLLAAQRHDQMLRWTKAGLDPHAWQRQIANATFADRPVLHVLEGTKRPTIFGRKLTKAPDRVGGLAVSNSELAMRQWEFSRSAALGEMGVPGITSVDDIFKFYTATDGLTAVIAGGSSAYRYGRIVWPGLTRPTRKAIAAKVWARDKMNWLDTAPKRLLDDLGELATDPAEWTRVQKAKVRLAELEQWVGRFGIAATSHIPRRNIIDISSNSDALVLEQFLRYSLPDENVAKIMGAFVGSVNPAMRREIVLRSMQDMMARMGVRDEFIRSWVDRVDQFRGQVFSLIDGNDVIGPPGFRTHAAIFPSQTAEMYIAIPDLRDMRRAVQNLTTYQAVLGVPNAPIVDAFMGKIWKPGVLLRLGFIPRAVGEETLAWIARSGFLSPIKQWFWMPLVDPERAPTALPWFLHPMGLVERRLRSRHVLGVLPSKSLLMPWKHGDKLPFTAGEIKVAKYLEGAVKRVAPALSLHSPDYWMMRYRAAHAAQYKTHFDMIAGRHHQMFNVDEREPYSILEVQGEKEVLVRYRAEPGKWQEINKSDPFFAEHFGSLAERFSYDPVAQRLVVALGSHIDETTALNVGRKLAVTDLAPDVAESRQTIRGVRRAFANAPRRVRSMFEDAAHTWSTDRRGARKILRDALRMVDDRRDATLLGAVARKINDLSETELQALLVNTEQIVGMYAGRIPRDAHVARLIGAKLKAPPEGTTRLYRAGQLSGEGAHVGRWWTDDLKELGAIADGTDVPIHYMDVPTAQAQRWRSRYAWQEVDEIREAQARAAANIEEPYEEGVRAVANAPEPYEWGPDVVQARPALPSDVDEAHRAAPWSQSENDYFVPRDQLDRAVELWEKAPTYEVAYREEVEWTLRYLRESLPPVPPDHVRLYRATNVASPEDRLAAGTYEFPGPAHGADIEGYQGRWWSDDRAFVEMWLDPTNMMPQFRPRGPEAAGKPFVPGEANRRILVMDIPVEQAQAWRQDRLTRAGEMTWRTAEGTSFQPSPFYVLPREVVDNFNVNPPMIHTADSAWTWDNREWALGEIRRLRQDRELAQAYKGTPQESLFDYRYLDDAEEETWVTVASGDVFEGPRQRPIRNVATDGPPDPRRPVRWVENPEEWRDGSEFGASQARIAAEGSGGVPAMDEAEVLHPLQYSDPRRISDPVGIEIVPRMNEPDYLRLDELAAAGETNPRLWDEAFGWEEPSIVGTPLGEMTFEPTATGYTIRAPRDPKRLGRIAANLEVPEPVRDAFLRDDGLALWQILRGAHPVQRTLPEETLEKIRALGGKLLDRRGRLRPEVLDPEILRALGWSLNRVYPAPEAKWFEVMSHADDPKFVGLPREVKTAGERLVEREAEVKLGQGMLGPSKFPLGKIRREESYVPSAEIEQIRGFLRQAYDTARTTPGDPVVRMYEFRRMLETAGIQTNIERALKMGRMRDLQRTGRLEVDLPGTGFYGDYAFFDEVDGLAFSAAAWDDPAEFNRQLAAQTGEQVNYVSVGPWAQTRMDSADLALRDVVARRVELRPTSDDLLRRHQDLDYALRHYRQAEYGLVEDWYEDVKLVPEVRETAPGVRARVMSVDIRPIERTQRNTVLDLLTRSEDGDFEATRELMGIVGRRMYNDEVTYRRGNSLMRMHMTRDGSRVAGVHPEGALGVWLMVGNEADARRVVAKAVEEGRLDDRFSYFLQGIYQRFGVNSLDEWLASPLNQAEGTTVLSTFGTSDLDEARRWHDAFKDIDRNAIISYGEAPVMRQDLIDRPGMPGPWYFVPQTDAMRATVYPDDLIRQIPDVEATRVPLGVAARNDEKRLGRVVVRPPEGLEQAEAQHVVDILRGRTFRPGREPTHGEMGEVAAAQRWVDETLGGQYQLSNATGDLLPDARWAIPALRERMDDMPSGAVWDQFHDWLRRVEVDDPVGTTTLIGTSRKAAIDEAADLGVAEVLKFGVDPTTRGVNYDYLSPIGRRRWQADQAQRLDLSRMDYTIMGPKLSRETRNWWTRLTRWFFDGVVPPPMRAVVRGPMFHEGMARAFEVRTPYMNLLRDKTQREWASKTLGMTGDYLDQAYLDIRPLFAELDDNTVMTYDNLRQLVRHASGNPQLEHVADDLPDQLARLVRPYESHRRLLDHIDEQLGLARAGKVDADQALARIQALRTKYGVKFKNPSHGVEGLVAERDVTFASYREIANRLDSDLKGLTSWWRNEDNAAQMFTEVASERAFVDALQFIDDHSIRSQGSVLMRNLMPFWYAEEQFLKRWARTMRQSPQAIRRVQLLVHGLRQMGTIRKDNYGEDVFVYPMSTELISGFAKVSEALTGTPYVLPIEVPLTGQVRYALPGMEQPGVPSFSPVVGIPLKLMADRFPELSAVEYAVMGERGVDRGIIDQLVPQSVVRPLEAILGTPESQREYAAAMMSVAQYMEAAGLTPEEDAGAHAWGEYVDRVENWTRSMLLIKSIFGFVGPSAPSMTIFESLTPEYRQLLQTMPVEDAIEQMIKLNPDARPWTVFQTTTKAKAPMPASQQTLAWFDEHKGIIEDYDMAGPWLLPRNIQTSDAPFFGPAYDQQLKLGLRERRSPEEYITELSYAQAAPDYFDARDRYQKAIAAARSPQERNNLRLEWQAAREAYFAMHPVFEAELRNPEATQRRETILAQMSEALADPRLPNRPEYDELRALMTSWDSLQLLLDELAYDQRTRARQARENARTTFYLWSEKYVDRHPNVRAYYLRVIRPEIGLSELEMDELEADVTERQAGRQLSLARS